MTTWKEFIFAITPALAIAIPTLLLVRWFLKNNLKIKQLELAMQQRKEMIPTRLQAYERISILLERISPESLIIREQKHGLTSIQFHHHLLKVIRSEMEHNLAMQVYMPAATWEKVIAARDEVIKLINSASGSIQPTTPSMELARHLLENEKHTTSFHIKKAKEQLKSDIQQFYFD